MDELLKKINFLFSSDNQAGRLLKPLADLFSGLPHQTLAIGLSGGADSAMLAATAAHLAPQYGVNLRAIHVHHGLMKEADEWVLRCQSLCDLLAIPIDVHYVSVNTQSGLGIEAAARQARYDAYQQFAQQYHITHFLLAHHLNDQAETVLLRLLRGTGVKGMRGMQVQTERMGIQFHRPWLSVDRTEILCLAKQFAVQTNWSAIQDASNIDIRFKRGAIRQLLSPALDTHWPSWKHNLSRHAVVMKEAQAIIDDMAALDLASLSPISEPFSFCLKSWRELPIYRQSNVLRYALAQLGIAMPTDKRLQNWLKQLREVHQLGFDREVKLPHENHLILVRKGRVVIEKV